MADVGGGVAGGLCGLCCSVIVEALQFSWLTQSQAGINCCKCCDTFCRCKCCWDAGEFDPNDYPENQSKATELQTKAEENGDSLPAYSKAKEMKVPETNVESSNHQIQNGEVSTTTEVISPLSISAANISIPQQQQPQVSKAPAVE